MSDEITQAMERAKDGNFTPVVPTRRQFSDALQALIDHADGQSVRVEDAERIALYLDGLYAAVSAHHAQVVAAVKEMDAHVDNDDVSLFLWRDDLLATLATLTPESRNG